MNCRAYAKALHYKEDEFHRGVTPKLLESLIAINNKLQQPDAAVGVLVYAKECIDEDFVSTCIYLYIVLPPFHFFHVIVLSCPLVLLSSVHISIHLFIYSSCTHPFIYPLIYSSLSIYMYPSIHPSVHPSIHPSILSSIHPFTLYLIIIYVSIHSSIHSSFHKFTRLFIDPSIN